MAHEEQLKFVEIVTTSLNSQTWKDFKVVEIGSYIVNESVRSYFPESHYVGVDLSAGPGVDLVSLGTHVELPNDFFEVAISCECFEHNPHWTNSFLEMYRMTKAGGVIIISCASRGRLEHGTSRTSPLSSPGTQSLSWNYYKNLNQKDFDRAFNLKDMFADFIFVYNPSSKDLYFLGQKKSIENSFFFKWDRVSIENKIKAISSLNNKSWHQKISLGSLKNIPLVFMSLFPDRFFQNFAYYYLLLISKLRSFFRIFFERN